MNARRLISRDYAVRAILTGSKTQERIVVDLPHDNPLGQWEPCEMGGPNMRDARGHTYPVHASLFHTRTGEGIGCPLGLPGDHLWVAEIWRVGAWHGRAHDRSPIKHWVALDYQADGHARREWLACNNDRLVQQSIEDARRAGRREVRGEFSWHPGESPCRWRSSSSMPRWASRIELEITSVRVERLHAISEADARDEGAAYHDGHGIGHSGWRHDYGAVHVDARSAYARLWSEQRGPQSWQSNPWVWALTFRRVDPSTDVGAQGA